MQVAPAEAAWAVVGVEMEAAPRGQEMERARGSVEFLGRWHENKKNRAMPLRFRADEDADGTGVRVGFGRFIDALVQLKALQAAFSRSAPGRRTAGTPAGLQFGALPGPPARTTRATSGTALLGCV